MDEDSSFEGKTYAIISSFKYLFTQSKEQGIKLLNKLFAFFDDISQYKSTTPFFSYEKR